MKTEIIFAKSHPATVSNLDIICSSWEVDDKTYTFWLDDAKQCRLSIPINQVRYVMDEGVDREYDLVKQVLSDVKDQLAGLKDGLNLQDFQKVCGVLRMVDDYYKPSE